MSIESAWRGMVTVGVVFSLLGARGPDGPPVTDAAKAGEWEVLRGLVEQGADVNVADPDGTTALHWASLHADVESVELLIGAGADANAANEIGCHAHLGGQLEW